jgi:hypothetical protein
LLKTAQAFGGPELKMNWPPCRQPAVAKTKPRKIGRSTSFSGLQLVYKLIPGSQQSVGEMLLELMFSLIFLVSFAFLMGKRPEMLLFVIAIQHKKLEIPNRTVKKDH